MVEVSICGMCKYYQGPEKNHACAAFPNGRDNYDELFPFADVECGNGYHFAPKPELEDFCCERVMRRFYKNTIHDDFEIVVP
ncbi:MAG: hypothetical protein IJH64_08475 [Oscillospiraceae bacterium]|nr:hypothetical protein [Oscillospiraceae bacterium]